MGGGKNEGFKMAVLFFLLRMIIFAVYFYPLLYRNGRDTGVTDLRSL